MKTIYDNITSVSLSPSDSMTSIMERDAAQADADCRRAGHAAIDSGRGYSE